MPAGSVLGGLGGRAAAESGPCVAGAAGWATPSALRAPDYADGLARACLRRRRTSSEAVWVARTGPRR
ncbi:hypothetical protein NDU88_006493 [Pleurodeles waltl]|uniref:Secreted protein n=1 Tax=Pleurodeles waltl TaxID=8319 RepID=A0AAV7RP06_PLEWA|nr:hypothetical protein NDU88_006493 [Pleurodeles waltl]